MNRRRTSHNARTEKTERNTEICRLRQEEGMTLESIGERYDITMQRVQAIVRRHGRPAA